MKTFFSQILHQQSCVLCQQNSRDLLCEYCFKDIPLINSTTDRGNLLNRPDVQKALKNIAFTQLFVPSYYRWPINLILKELKFSQKQSMAKVLGNIFLRHYKNLPNKTALPDAIVPMPIHIRRFAMRKYNQCREIAETLSQEFGIPIYSDLCERTKHTPAQTTLSGKQRSHNLKNVFCSIQQSDLRHIAILDDVITTGATVNTLYQCIKNQNPHLQIDIWAMSISLPHQ